MAEPLRLNPEEAFRAEHGPSDAVAQELYYIHKTERIKDFQKTWMVQNFDTESGRVYGLWYLGEQIAFVDDEGDGNVRVYGRVLGEEEPAALLDSKSLWEAISFTESWFGLDIE